MGNKENNRIAYKTYGFTSDDIETYSKNTGRDFYKDWKERKHMESLMACSSYEVVDSDKDGVEETCARIREACENIEFMFVAEERI